MDIAYFMGCALRQAETALENGELPIGAVTVLNGEILSPSYTQEKTQKRLLVHAELLALEAADKLVGSMDRRRQVQLFTTLEPCLMCMGAALSFPVSSIYYALEAPGDGATRVVQEWISADQKALDYRLPALHGGIYREQSRRLFQQFVERYPTLNGMWTWAKRLADLPPSIWGS